MITAMIVLFVIGYICIASEHVLNINKATFALILCGILWAVYATCGHDPDLSEDMVTALGDTCEIVVFLIGAMTIVELIDRYGGFNIIVRHIKAKNKRGLMWILALFAFCAVGHTRQHDNHHHHGHATAPHALRPERTLALRLCHRHSGQCRRRMVANRRHHHNHAVDEKLRIIGRPHHTPPAALARSRGTARVDCLACHQIGARRSPQRVRPPRRLCAIRAPLRPLRRYPHLRCRRTPLRARLQGHDTPPALHGHTPLARRAVARHRTHRAPL